MKLRSFKKEQQKNEKEIVSVDGVFFDNSQQFINLKKKQPFIEIHFKVFVNFIDHFKVPIGIVIITFIALTFLGSVFVSKANVATFYPDSCLGGWDNPSLASGKPDLDTNASPQDFTKGNSAVIKGTADLYCGGFKGEIPEDSSPKNFILTLNWSIDDGSIIHNEPQPFDLNTNVIDSITPQVIETPENIPTDVPEIPAIDMSEQQSFLDRIIPRAFAQESDVPPDVPPVVDAPTNIDVLPVVPDAEKPVEDNAKDEVPIVPEQNNTELTETTESIDNTDTNSLVDLDVISPTSDNPQIDAGTESIDISTTAIEEPADSFMDVVYTIDGTTWTSLGKIGRNNWQSVSFDIPLTSWNDLSQFQIALIPIQTIDTYPVIYLDGMLLSVEYESEIKIEVKEATPIYEITNIQNSGSKIILSNEGTILSPDQILVTGEDDILGNVAVYNKITGIILLTTTVGEKTYALDLSYFGVGEYTVINTTDPDICSSRTLEECLGTTDFVGSATFSVKNKAAPPETADTQTGESEDLDGINPLPGSTLPQIPSDPIIENAPDVVLDILNIDGDIPKVDDQVDKQSESIDLPPVDTSSGQEVSF